MIERLKGVPDLKQKAMVAELAEKGIVTCPFSVWQLVRSEGMSFKKACSPKSRRTPRSLGRRRSGKSFRGGLTPDS